MHNAIMQVVFLMLCRSRCDITATEMRHFSCRPFRQMITRHFLNVHRRRLTSLRLSDFQLSTIDLPIAVQTVLPMLVCLIHLPDGSLISTATFLIICHYILKRIYNGPNLVLHVHICRVFHLVLDESVANRNELLLKITVSTIFKIKLDI